MSQTAPFPKLKRGLVAILRGLKATEAMAMGEALFDAGIEAIEVPLNSPQPFSSIARIVQVLPKTALVGADLHARLLGGGARFFTQLSEQLGFFAHRLDEVAPDDFG